MTDALLSSIMQAKGKNPAQYPYLSEKTNNVACAPEQDWARLGVLELNVIRNCLVHNDRKWSDRGLKQIKPLVNNILAKIGDPVEVNFEDVFRYKRAVRTLLNQAETKGFRP